MTVDQTSMPASSSSSTSCQRLGWREPGDVGVRELVDENERRPACERAVEIELAQHPLAVAHFLQRQHFETGGQRLRLGTAVGLDDADDDVDALLALGARRRQHGEGLADAGRSPEEDLQLAALRLGLLLLEAAQDLVGIRALVRHGASTC